MNKLHTEGFQIQRSVFSPKEVERLREISNKIAIDDNSVCVRHIRDKSAELNQLATSEKLTQLIPPGLAPVRSILFDKTKESNWPVPWHQDLTIAVQKKQIVSGYSPWSIKDNIAHVQPPVSLLNLMFTARIHLDETSGNNGALRVISGSHLHGRISSEKINNYPKEQMTSCICSPGDVLVMSPLILHSSQKSAAPNRRRILHFEYAPREQLDKKLTWHEE